MHRAVLVPPVHIRRHAPRSQGGPSVGREGGSESMRRAQAGQTLLSGAALLLWSGLGACGDVVKSPNTHIAADAGLPSKVDSGLPEALPDAGQGRPMDATAPPPLHQRLPDPEAVGTEFLLSQTHLYSDIASKRIREDAIELTPRYPLWTDGAQKRRWLVLPAGERIDTRDPDRWNFPVGTLAFKEFRTPERLLETRLIARTGPGEDDFWMGSFLWDADETDARFVPEGESDVLHTQHDVPEVRNCWTCHRGEAARLLGISAIQSPALDPMLLTAPVPLASIEGSPAAEALGYLHGNCGHCHNPAGSARPDTDLDLRLRTQVVDITETPSYLTSVDVPLQYFAAPADALRIVPGEPQRSAVLQRMQERGADTQMPPLGSEVVDREGLRVVRTWIESL